MSSPTSENRLLAALPPDDLSRLTARMTDIFEDARKLQAIIFDKTGTLTEW